MVLLPFVITLASLFILQQARIGGCCNPNLRAEVPGISPGLALLRRATVSGYTMAADCVSMLRLATVSDYKMAADCASTREICDVFSSLFLPLMLFLLFQVAAGRWTSPLDNAGRMTSPIWIPPQVSHRVGEKYLFNKYFLFRSLPDVRDYTGI